MHFILAGTESDDFLYDIPFGTIKRPAMDLDVPGLTYACALPDEQPALAIISREKYGYRCTDEYMSLTLIRSSSDPDPFPELFRHRFTFHVAMPAQTDAGYLAALSKRLCHPAFSRSVTAHAGTLPAQNTLMACDAAVSGVKLAEDGTGDIIIRLYEETGTARDAALSLPADTAKTACLCSLTEVPGEALTVSGGNITVPLPAHGIVTVRVRR